MKNIKTFEDFVNESIQINEMINPRSRTNWKSIYTQKVPQEKIVKLILKYTDDKEWADAVGAKWRETGFMNNIFRYDGERYGYVQDNSKEPEQQKIIEKIREDKDLEKLRMSEWLPYMRNSIDAGNKKILIGNIQKIFLGYNHYGMLFEVSLWVIDEDTTTYVNTEKLGEFLSAVLDGKLPKNYTESDIQGYLAHNNNVFKDYVKLTNSLRDMLDRRGIIFSTGRS